MAALRPRRGERRGTAARAAAAALIAAAGVLAAACAGAPRVATPVAKDDDPVPPRVAAASEAAAAPRPGTSPQAKALSPAKVPPAVADTSSAASGKTSRASAQPAPSRVAEPYRPTAQPEIAPPRGAERLWPRGADERLASLSQSRLPDGAELVVLRRPSALVLVRIALDSTRFVPDDRNAGLDALALYLASKGGADMAEGEIDRALRESSAELSLVLDRGSGPALQLSCPEGSLFPILDLLGRSFAAPAFRAADFEACLWKLRVEERRRSSDRARLAGLELGASLRGESWLDRRPAGEASSLAGLSLAEVVRFWKDYAAGPGLRILAVGGVDREALVARLSSPQGLALGSLPDSRSLAVAGSRATAPSTAPSTASATAPATLPASGSGAPSALARTVALSLPAEAPPLIVKPVPGSSGWAIALGEYDAPSIASADFAALRVATTALGDLLSRELGTLGGRERLRLVLDAGGPGAGSVELSGGADADAALGCFERALAELVSGRCVDPVSPDGALTSLAAALSYYRERGIVDFYEPFAPSGAMADELSRVVASGAEAAEFYKTAGRMAAVNASEVRRAAAKYLSPGALSWIALGDPSLLDSVAAKLAAKR